MSQRRRPQEVRVTWCCRRTLTALGPSFIKAGQVLASRPDIVRADYMEELCTLQDDVPSFPDDIVSPSSPQPCHGALSPETVSHSCVCTPTWCGAGSRLAHCLPVLAWCWRAFQSSC